MGRVGQGWAGGIGSGGVGGAFSVLGPKKSSCHHCCFLSKGPALAVCPLIESTLAPSLSALSRTSYQPPLLLSNPPTVMERRNIGEWRAVERDMAEWAHGRQILRRTDISCRRRYKNLEPEKYERYATVSCELTTFTLFNCRQTPS